ncbi:hypothetical protein Gotri_026500, partial [Gossypium trilobum]|nr:hypothetical protein [Gossypium trilobum]
GIILFTWPPEDTLVPWDIKIEPPTPYQKYSAIENTPAWTNLEKKTSPIEMEDNFDNLRDGLEQQIEQMEIKCYRAKEEKAKMIKELNITSDVSIHYESD